MSDSQPDKSQTPVEIEIVDKSAIKKPKSPYKVKMDLEERGILYYDSDPDLVSRK